MTKNELRALSNDTLSLLLLQITAELDRRGLKADVIQLHPGNANGGKPVPMLVRVLRRIPTLPPGDLAKVETLLDGWAALRAARACEDVEEGR